jgi:hypothetical protein
MDGSDLVLRVQRFSVYAFTYLQPSSGGGGGPVTVVRDGDGKTPATPTPPVVGGTAQLNRAVHVVVLNGRKSGAFDPETPITRAEAAAIFSRLTVGFSEDGTYPSSYTDISDGTWYQKYAGFLESNGLITGFDDGTFRGNQPITRAQFVAILSRFAGMAAQGEEVPPQFSDLNDSWAAEAIAHAVNAGWVQGYSDGTVRPNAYITRAAAAAIVCRALDRLIDETSIANLEPRPFTDIDSNYWAYWYIAEASTLHDFTHNGSKEIWVAR